MLIKDSYKIFTPRDIDVPGNSINNTRVHKDLVYIQILNIFDNNKSYTYNECWEILFKPRNLKKGHDFDLFKSLAIRKLIKHCGYGKYRAPIFTITELGKLVLNNSRINNTAYRVIRHFDRVKDDFIEKIIQEDLAGQESWKDLLPETVLEMFKSIFTGDIFIIGSNCYWINKVIDCYKKSKEFRNIINTNAIKSYIECLSLSNTAMNNFKIKLAKINVRK